MSVFLRSRSKRLAGRTHARAPFLGVLLLAMTVLVVAGCKAVDVTSWFQDPEEQREAHVRDALRGGDGHPKRVGDYVAIVGLQPRVIQGVGLVVGLRDTGEDPPASNYRTALLDDMRHRQIPNPNEVLQSLNTALVVVTGYVPPLIRPGDRIDISVQLPPGSQAGSLAGGRLVECQLIEHGQVEGGAVLQGDILGKAEGHLLVSAIDSDASVMAQRNAVIPGGALYVGEDQDLALYMRNDYRSWRLTQRIATRIGERFSGYDESGQKRPLAEALTDNRIRLTLDDHYRDYPDRYLRVIREIRPVESNVERNIRMQTLQDRLAVGPTAALAAIELEAIGNEAIPILKEGLQSPSLEARFYAAEALAYLGRTEGVETLAHAADTEPAFRVYALAALAAVKEAESVLVLQGLLKHESVETRAGAWRALTMISRDNPSIPSLVINDQFRLYVIDSPTPLIHLTRTKRAEIAIFGHNQQLLAPMLLHAGPDIMVRAEPGGHVATVTRISADQPVQRVQVPLTVDSVIRAVANLGATYPDVVQLLVEADQQYNLSGPVAIDEYPQAGRIYERPSSEVASGGASSQAITTGELPWLFGGHPEDDAEPLFDPAVTDELPVIDETAPATEAGGHSLSPMSGNETTTSGNETTTFDEL